MIAALFAMAAVWLAAGWIAARTSRRAARLWVALALVALGCANALQIVQSPGPWWPLIGQGLSLADLLAVLLWIAALLLAFRVRHRGWQAVLAVMGCAVGVFAVALVAAAAGHSRDSGSVCLGQSARIGAWSAHLRDITPVAGDDFTGLQAVLDLRSGDGPRFDTHLEDREYLAGGHPRYAGSSVLHRWNGELVAEVAYGRQAPGCMAVTLEWRLLGQWLGYAAWASLAGALLMLAAACRSHWRRAAAWQRIAMRREDRARGAVPVTWRRLPWQPLALALALGLPGIICQLDQGHGSRKSADPAAIGSAALVAARGAAHGGKLSANRWIIIADALMRHGESAEAVNVLRGAVVAEPDNAEAWLAMGDALYAHSGRAELVPAASYAYYRSDQAEARAGRVPGLVLDQFIRSGRMKLALQWMDRHWREDDQPDEMRRLAPGMDHATIRLAAPGK